MFGKRDITPWGVDKTIFGYIKDNKFIFTDDNFEFDLEGGEVVRFESLQTGGFCMVDYIEMENGYIYTLNEECIFRYNTKEAFIESFEEQELDHFDGIEQGLIVEIEGLENAPQRTDDDLIKQEEIYQAWAKELDAEAVEA